MMTPARFAELAGDVRREHGIEHDLPSLAQMINDIMVDSGNRHEWGGEVLRSMLECLKHLPRQGESLPWDGIAHVLDTVLALEAPGECDPGLALQGFGELDCLYHEAAKSRFTTPPPRIRWRH